MAKSYSPKKRNFKDTNMNLNENPFSPPKKILNLKKSNINLYSPLSSNLINKLSNFTKLSKKLLFIGSGCNGLLHIVCDTLIKKNDKVLLLAPFWPRTENYIKNNTSKITKIKSKKDYSYNIDKILKKNKYDFIFFSNPNNPTGIILNHNKIIEIIQKNKNSIIVIDEALMNYNNKKSFELVKKFNNLIILRSFSKNFGLAGLRIGFGCASLNLANKIKEKISNFETSVFSQMIAEKILDEKKYLNKYVKNLNYSLFYIKKELNKLGLSYSDSSSINLIVNVKSLGLTADKVISFLKKSKVNVTPILNHFDGLNNSKYLFRLSLGIPKNNKKFINLIKKLKN